MAGTETSLKQMLAKALDVRTSTVVIGAVESTSPLEIRAENDPRLIITESNCFVPTSLQDYTVDISIPGVGTKECTVRNGLEEGDRVYMLSFERGALYFILDKVGD